MEAGSAAATVRVFVPMKPLATAKSRLASFCGESFRGALALALLDRVLSASVEAVGPGAVTVLGGDEQIRRLAKERSTTWIEDPGWDLNSSLWIAFQRAFRSEGCAAVLFLPGDLPLVTSEDIHALLHASNDHVHAVAARASADGGTNALLLSRSSAFPPALGQDSFASHAAAALGAGVQLNAVDRRGLAFDVDTVVEARWALSSLDGFAQEAACWQAHVEEFLQLASSHERGRERTADEPSLPESAALSERRDE